MEVKNRIVMSPMGLNAAHSDGTIDNDEIDYFEERARGGTGLIGQGRRCGARRVLCRDFT